MADVTLPKFFDIIPSTEDGLDLKGNPTKHKVRTCSASREEVRDALRFVAAQYPELSDIMKVAIAMQCRLDTIRSETKLQVLGIRRKAQAGQVDDVFGQADTLVEYLGTYEQTHELYVH